MSFISSYKGSGFEAGYFLLDDENAVRETRQIPKTMATADEHGRYIVKGGTPFPSNDTNARGIVYEDVDVTSGDMPGSVVVAGRIVESNLPVTLQSAAKTALKNNGFTVV